MLGPLYRQGILRTREPEQSVASARLTSCEMLHNFLCGLRKTLLLPGIAAANPQCSDVRSNYNDNSYLRTIAQRTG